MVDKIMEDFKNADIPMTEETIKQKIRSVEVRINNKSKVNKYVD
jgi:orotidine-5'-phosphate decarboxylase